MVSTPDHLDEDFDLAAERAERTGWARADRRFLTRLAAVSLLLHGIVLSALLWIERAPDEAQRAKEIPVELIVEPPPSGKSGETQAKTEKPSAPASSATNAKSEAEQKPPGASTAKPEDKPAAAQAKTAEPSTSASNAKPEDKPVAQAKTAEPPPSARPAKAAPRAAPSAAKEAAQTSARPADKPAARTASATSAGDGEAWRGAPAGLALPYDLGPEIFRAVAVPLPVEGGDEPMDYKVIVFGMLARAKHYPETAIERGARGVATVGFSVDEAGQVTSVALLQSSGEADLDEESVAVVRRAAPFPAPPPGAPRSFGAEITFGLMQ